ncbi:uncharacterized protein EHS24_001230 [Apiotrichum porosum]|uniref:Major facilitator superfamily (MFS) profile domain-containing protein n=1 Tax=Apiotrichum porosum TaxID=105984 RepID=A0A427XJX2_9TREE|nr:uncharacterized protein EHS24_001230 [Apiotrichum porosum]RSH79191.1 hypothetical protein EHS24_001230 [Apiotrichum porosum]
MSAVTHSLTADDAKFRDDKPEVEHREGDATDSSPEPASFLDMEYDNDDQEPELHARTYVALAALFVLNYVQVFALNGPPSVLSYIGTDLNATAQQQWVPNALSLVQAVGGPVIAFASDTFQARKIILIVSCLFSLVGAAIAPGAKDIYRLIVSQILIGIGFAAAPLAFAIPSEILPRKWRPLAQSLANVAGSLGSLCAPLITGALTKKSEHNGWRNFYWIQTAMWGATVICLLVGYRPPKRHSFLDNLTMKQKISRLDLPGMFLLTCALTLLLAGLSLGGNPWPWGDYRVLVPLVLGIVFLVVFAVYEWKGTSTGILHHQLFKRRTFAVCIVLIFIEGILLFSVMIFYPQLTTIFTTDPFISSLRQMPYWVAASVCTVIYGFWSSKRRTVRSPVIVGFALLTAGVAGLATVQPLQSTNAIIFSGLAGIGFAGPLILLIAAVQLSVPHHLIATATAVLTSSRAVAASVFTAIFGAAVSSEMPVKLPAYTAAAAIKAGLDPQYVSQFVGDMLGGDTSALQSIPGITLTIIEAGKAAVLQANADSFRYVFIIAAPFGAAACLISWFIGDLSDVMNYHVDAPVEELHAREKHEHHSTNA